MSLVQIRWLPMLLLNATLWSIAVPVAIMPVDRLRKKLRIGKLRSAWGRFRPVAPAAGFPAGQTGMLDRTAGFGQ
jgi:hypothetical protein